MYTKNSTRARIAAGFTVAALTVAACGGGDDESAATTIAGSPDTTPVTEPEQEVVTSDAPVTTESATTVPVIVDDIIRQPLTGEVVATEADKITRPALAVKIDNNDRNARPNHSGLGVADIVFEEIVEGDTRFAAVFHSTDADPVGPIRSGRSQDVDLLSSFNEPLFAWSGGNAGVTRLIADSFLTDLNWQKNAGSYQRGPGAAPNNLYSSTETLYGLTPDDQPGPPSQQFAYTNAEMPFVGQAVDAFDLSMRGKRIRWEWDAQANGFARFQSDSRHVDKIHGDIFAKNVIVMVADYKASKIDSRSPEAQTLGSGPVYVFSDGKVAIGRWERGLAITPMKLTDLDGNPIALTPGNTWIEVAEITNDPEGDGSFTIEVQAFLDAQAAAFSEDPPPPIVPVDIVLNDPERTPTDITIDFAGV